MTAKAIITLSFFLLCFFSKGQEVYVKNISEQISLPSEECYNVIQDKEEFIWISTEKGLLKLSATSKKTYPTNNNPLNGAIYGTGSLSDSSLIFLTATNSVLTYRNNLFNTDNTLNRLIGKISKNLNYIYSIQNLNQGKFIVQSRELTFLLDTINEKIDTIHSLPKEKTPPQYRIYTDTKEAYYTKNILSLSQSEFYNNNYNVTFELRNGSTVHKFTIDFKKGGYPDPRTLILRSGNKVYFSIHNKLLEIQQDFRFRIIDFPSRIIALYRNSKGGLWIGTTAGGGYYYDQSTKIAPEKADRYILKGFSVSGFCEDRENNLWCTTLEKGVYFSPYPDIEYFRETIVGEKKSHLLGLVDDKIFTSSEWNKLLVIKKDKTTEIKKFSTMPTHYLDYSDIISFNDNLYLASKGYLEIYNKHFRPIGTVKHIKERSDVCTFGLDTATGRLFGISSTYLIEINGMNAIPLFKLISKGRAIKTIDSNTIYFGCDNGLYRYDISTKKTIKINGIKTPVNRIIQTANKKILVATSGEGLLFVTNERAKRIIPDQETMYINDVIEDNNEVIWIASNNGIYRYDYKTENIQLLNTSNGLLSNHINKIVIMDNRIYASSSNGLFSFPATMNLFNHHTPHFALKSLAVNTKEKQLGNGLILSHSENNIQLIFDIFTYKKGAKEGLFYKLRPYDNEYNFSQNGIIDYKHLPPGNYQLSVYVQNNNGIKSNGTFILNISISPPFWKEKWFYITCFTLFLLTLFFILKRIIRRIKEKEEEKFRWKKLISESQLSALQAQMNPHFIFNAINSIQNYILDRDEKQAYDYLSMFSKLIRRVLNNSRQGKITLADELATLSLYVEIEKLRFENTFDYIVTIDKDINPDEIFIPSMIIQPYIENAIWHGLINLKGERKGVLTLSIVSADTSFLSITIDDNGIGRKKALQYRKHNVHPPEGMEITKKRIELTNLSQNDIHNDIKITDKYDTNGTAAGTTVELRIKTDKKNELQ